MVSIKTLCSVLSVASLTSGVVGMPAAPQYGQPVYRCGKTDVFFTGLPLNYPRGGDAPGAPPFDPKAAAAAVAADKANILKAGYNIKTVFIGLEQPEGLLATNLYVKPSRVQYDVVAIGFGVRGAPLLNTTIQFENDIELFRNQLPRAPIVFNLSPGSTLDALKRKAPITEDCSKTPGKDYGSYVYCDPKLCTTPLE